MENLYKVFLFYNNIPSVEKLMLRIFPGIHKASMNSRLPLFYYFRNNGEDCFTQIKYMHGSIFLNV